MLIEGTATAVAFGVFVAPGAYWAWRAERRRATVNRSQLMEAAIIGLASAAFSGPALVLTALLLWMVDRDLSTLTEWLGPNSQSSGGALLAQAVLLVVQLVLAILLAEVCYRWLGAKLLGQLDTTPVSGWARVFRQDKPQSCEVMVEVLLDDGSVVRGLVETYTPDYELGDRELVLAPPIRHELKGVSVFDKRPTPERLVLPVTSIRSVAIRYVMAADLEGRTGENAL